MTDFYDELQIPVRIQRWHGKPTSGRFVYKGRESGDWVWQCDLHPEENPPDDQWGTGATMEEAFAEALEHAYVCEYRAAKETKYD